MINLPRNRYRGVDLDQPDRPEAEHFARCPACGAVIDLRDLGAVLDHLGAGATHPASDRPQ
jgi:hypothetical protein